ncbi:hypothetical protein C0J52_12231 [Blattella germanica]|nr:hypothetical protein C0J52_12231 [Blattella germanica]
MAFPVKQVRTLEQRLRIIEEVEKNPKEKRVDIAKRLGLPPSTLNSIISIIYGGKEGADDDDDDEEAESETLPVPSFRDALNGFETMRAFIYAHDITERDQINIVNIESLLFGLKRKGANKQMKISDFFVKK